ncbi:MAG: hypothetical protein ACFWT0_01595 [Bifidobacterium crudilactis]|jgi:hypothetical protein|uniref:hypothetical protein n=1 Tax=Bifidobacterium crudilactis TaxID=327277 RepID=UPI003A5C2634
MTHYVPESSNTEPHDDSHPQLTYILAIDTPFGARQVANITMPCIACPDTMIAGVHIDPIVLRVREVTVLALSSLIKAIQTGGEHGEDGMSMIACHIAPDGTILNEEQPA